VIECGRALPCFDHPRDPRLQPKTARPPRKASAPAGTTKKAALLALYRQHEDYGDRSRVSPIATELAEQAGLQPGTARTYLYEHLDAGEGDAR
jgi:hypothetical protein